MSEHMPGCRIEDGKAVCVAGCCCAKCRAGTSARVVCATDSTRFEANRPDPAVVQELHGTLRGRLRAISLEPIPGTALSPARRVKVRMEARRRARGR